MRASFIQSHSSGAAGNRPDQLEPSEAAQMVWLYGGLIKNRKAASQPLALLAFQEVLGPETLDDRLVYAHVVHPLGYS